MLEHVESPKEITTVFEGIESQLDRSLSVQRDTIEKELVERVAREKEEAQKRIDAAEREIAESRRVLESHKAALAELKSAKEQLQGRIKGHMERAASCQQMMEKMSGQAYEEYEQVNHLGLELDGVRQRADRETALLRKHLEEKYGLKADIQAVLEPSETMAEVRQQMLKMKRVRELLETGSDAAAPEAPAEAPFAAPAEREAERPAEPPAERPVLRGHPQISLIETLEPAADVADAEGAAQEPDASSDYDYAEAAEAEEVRMLTERLAQYRRSEPVFNGTEFAYFQKGKRMVLDGESFIGTLAKVSDVARGLHINLGQKEMSKDLFLIKQEILNQQEVLRKTFLRVVRFCEKEDGTLPKGVAEVLTVRTMKDILERLTFGNWSNPADFNAFLDHVAFLRAALKKDVGSSRDYLRSVLDQLEGGGSFRN
ncbi:MAG TPA: hypothetical protein VMS75_00175 [Terriglobales bacterium]|nr:hypothetical protein [Terriglobales bacterium]